MSDRDRARIKEHSHQRAAPLPAPSAIGDERELEALRARPKEPVTQAGASDGAATPARQSLSLARRVGNRRFGRWMRSRPSASTIVAPEPPLATGALITPPHASLSPDRPTAGHEIARRIPADDSDLEFGLPPVTTLPAPPELGSETTARPAGGEQAVTGERQAAAGPQWDGKAMGPSVETARPPGDEQATVTGPQAGTPVTDGKAMGPSAETSRPPGDEQATITGPQAGTPVTDGKAVGPTTESEVQATVGVLQAESTALGGTTRQAEVTTEAPVPSDRAPTLAAEGRSQTADADATSREEAAEAEVSARESTAPGAAPREGSRGGIGVDPGALDAAPLDAEALGPGAERALARARQWIESAVGPVIGRLNPMGAVVSALNAIHNMATQIAGSLSRAVTTAWQAVSGAIRTVVSTITRQATSLLASARAAAQRVVAVVSSALGGAADAVMERIRALRRAAYGRVVQMVQSARAQGIARLTGFVTSVVDRVRATGQQIRAGIQAVLAAVVAAIRSARSAAGGELDRLLGSGGSAWQAGAVRARLRAWARQRLYGLAQSVRSGRAATVSSVRTALFALIGHIGLFWQAADRTFRATFAEPLAQAREHAPELVGQVEMGIAQAEGQLSQPGPVADLELGLVERELDAAAAQLSVEAEETGTTL